MLALDFHDGGMVHVVIMIMGDDHGIDGRNVLNLTGYLCIAFGAKPCEWTATLAENGVK